MTQKVVHLVLLKMLRLWSNCIVILHSFKEFIVNQLMSLFPAKLISVSIANLLSIIFQNIKGNLKHFTKFDDFVFFKCKKIFFPFLERLKMTHGLFSYFSLEFFLFLFFFWINFAFSCFSGLSHSC